MSLKERFARPTRYDISRTYVTFGGLPIRGYAPGSVIVVRRNTDVWKTVTGTNGEFRRILNVDKSGSIEITLRQTAPANNLLGGFLTLDENIGTVVAPLGILNIVDNSVFMSVDAFIRGYPTVTMNQNESDTVWTFDCDELRMVYPGLLQAPFLEPPLEVPPPPA